MTYRIILISLLALAGLDIAVAAVSEVEPNSTVIGSALIEVESNPLCKQDANNQRYCTTYIYRVINVPYDPLAPDFSPVGSSARNTSLAKPLSLTDEYRGQLRSTRDFDWFYVDISPEQAQRQTETPVYFGCDSNFGELHEGFPNDTEVTVDDAYWLVSYFYDSDPSTPLDAQPQSDYVVSKELCRRGEAEIKGPFRFQMNTSRPGRYYVRIWGRYAGDRLEKSTVKTTYAEAGTTIKVLLTSVSTDAAAFVIRNENTLASTTASVQVGETQSVSLPNGTETINVLITVEATNPGSRTAIFGVNGDTPQNYPTGQGPEKTGGVTNVTIDSEVERYYNQIIVNTAFYSLRLYTAKTTGELEPNDGIVEAYELTSGASVAAQLASMYDQDWFYIFNDATRNTTNKLNFYFTCKGQTGTSYVVSTYNQSGVLQNTYEVKAEQCNGASGFSFTINTPSTARYYFEITSPNYTQTAQFTQSDYTVLAVGNGLTNPTPEIPSRRPGDLEPNEKVIDAVPLNANTSLTAQLSSVTDLDWFTIDYTAEATSTGFTEVTFACKAGAAGSSAVWELTAYNSQSAPQASYSITAAQCSSSGGLTFNLSTPTSGRYPILINAKADSTGASFSQADYTLRFNPILSSGSGNTATRLPGEPEPNDTLANAFPLTSTAAVTAQLSSVDDLDYFYYDNNVATNPRRTLLIYFRCNVAAESGANYVLSNFNPQGQLQQN